MPEGDFLRAIKTRRAITAICVALGVSYGVGNAATLQWDASGTSAGSPMDGAGNWDLSSARWSNRTVDSIWPGDGTTATFGNGAGAAGAINIAVPINAGGLVFNPPGSGNYNLSGSALTLGAGTIYVNNSNPSIANVISGSNGLTLSGNGSLTLSGSNNYSGTTNVSGGTLIDAAAGAIASGNLSVGQSGTVTFNCSETITGDVYNAGTINIPANQTLNVPGASSVFNQTNGSLNINGLLNFAGSGFYESYPGGTINGTVVLSGSTPTFDVGNLKSGIVAINNSGSQAILHSSVIPAGTTVLFQPTGNSTFNASSLSSVTDQGTLTLQSADGCTNTFSSPVLFVYGTFNVTASGTPSGPTTINSSVNTFAGSTVNFNTSAIVNGYFGCHGTVNIAAGQTVGLGTGNNQFNQGGGTVNVSGIFNAGSYVGVGRVNGIMTLIGSSTSVDFYGVTEPASGTYLISTNGSSASLRSNIPTGAIVIFEPVRNSTLSGTFGNRGTLELIATNGLSVTQSGNLSNAGLFITTSTGTPLGAILLTGVFNNQTGAIAFFNTSTTVSGGIINSGTFNISAGGALNDTAFFSDSGVINYLPANSGAIFQRSTGFAPSLGAGAVINVGASANASSRQLLIASNGLSLSGSSNNWTSLINLNNNDLDLVGRKLMNISNQAKQGFNGGGWNGAGGIISISAGNDTTHLTALGVIQNNQSGSALFTVSHQFDGITPGASDILIKYTYYGDANLDGKVDGSDYSLIDSGFLSHATGWLNGDFNYDGLVNGSDYTLIDNAFDTQGAKLAAEVNSVSSVPEPVWLGGLGASAGVLFGRRRRTADNLFLVANIMRDCQ